MSVSLWPTRAAHSRTASQRASARRTVGLWQRTVVTAATTVLVGAVAGNAVAYWSVTGSGTASGRAISPRGIGVSADSVDGPAPSGSPVPVQTTVHNDGTTSSEADRATSGATVPTTIAIAPDPPAVPEVDARSNVTAPGLPPTEPAATSARPADVIAVTIAGAPAADSTIGADDSVTVSFARAIEPATVCASWAMGDATLTGVSVTLARTDEVTATLTASVPEGACGSTSLSFGAVAVDRRYLDDDGSRHVTFSDSTLSISADGTSLTLVLGAPDSPDALRVVVAPAGTTFTQALPVRGASAALGVTTPDVTTPGVTATGSF